MAEIKNNFISSKMNQDIDDRLMPNNEYRYALNLEVNRSESSDVGTLQNILGNSLAVDFNTAAETEGLESIGVLTDETNNNIYVFLTNYSGTNYSPTAENYIYVYNDKQNTTVKLVSGAWLNFSTKFPVYGVNLVENLLFWTDNRNQPRRINVQKAFYNTNYYTNEEQISVAKISPLYAPELLKVSDFNLPLSATATVGAVTGTGPYTATITPASPFSSELLEVGDVVHATAGTSSFTTGVVTSVTKSGLNITSFVVSSVTIFTSGNVSVLYADQYETTMYDVSSPELPNGITNPYYEQDWPGDPAYLEGRYVRFSYRYKFEDGEYSIMAPFTQIAYIPKQDGYFLYSSVSPTVNDEESAYRSTIVGFMQNKVNNILLQIILPGPANEIYQDYKITEIEILYKEADALDVSAVDSIPTLPDPSKGISPDPPYIWNTSSTVYSYDYQSKKPFKTLPNRDTVRVYDITPVKALSQEIVGNRVVYGNYQDKNTYPKYLNYNVGASEKLPFGFIANHGTSVVEYPNHSVKENRNYQVGVVLCDKFGRQSGVILSNQTSTYEPGQFGASSLYLPYSNIVDVVPFEWRGNSLKILFNETISPTTPDANTGWPGLYNGDANSANYNPLGWYAYKIVVKQTEQDYYNVYLPGVMAAYPENTTLELGKTSHVVLLNDNINKVPRDLSEVGPSQKQFRSSVILYPRVNNNTELYGNEQYDPGNTYSFVNTIATNNSLFFPNGVYPDPPRAAYNNFYQIDSDPLIARISTVDTLGVIATTPPDVINLAVYETKPVESRLDIYWETSTAGLISELNTAIEEGSDYSIETLNEWSFSLFEEDAPGTIVTDPFYFDDILGNKVTLTSVVIESVVTGENANVSSKFVIEKITGTEDYRIKTATTPSPAYFYYGFDADTAEAYTFTIRATINVSGSPPFSKLFITTGALQNNNPIITNKPTEPISVETGETYIYQFEGVNGSNAGGNNETSDLFWEVFGDGSFSINSSGLLQESSGSAQGTYNMTIVLRDAGGATDSVDITVVYPIPTGNVTIYNINGVGQYAYINNVTVNEVPVELDPGFSFPILPGQSATASYNLPASSASLITMYSEQSYTTAVNLEVAGIGGLCAESNGTSTFYNINLSSGPNFRITLNPVGSVCE